MNWASIYSGSNNVYSNLPPMMSDGRNYSNLLPDEVINDTIKKERVLLLIGIIGDTCKHASHIIKHNSQSAISATGLVEDPSNYVPVNFL